MSGFYIYFGGTATGDDFSNYTLVKYGQPTSVPITSPVLGQSLSVDVTPSDLAGFLSGNMGNIKVRRIGGDAYTGDVVLRGVTVKYRKKSS